jgi:hypothetical protein
MNAMPSSPSFRAAAWDPAARSYTDLSLTTVSDEDETKLDLVSATAGGRAAAARAKQVGELTTTAPDKVTAAALPRGVRLRAEHVAELLPAILQCPSPRAHANSRQLMRFCR